MILIDFEDGLGRITISRVEKANSLTAGMLAELEAAFLDLRGRPDLRAVILTGAGKVFSAGADLEAARAGLATSPLWERLSGAVSGMPCLTVAALNGTVAGGAMGMVLACDLRIAVPEARFFYPVMRLGYLPQPSDPARLAALAGPSRARVILLAGQKIGAEEALAWGLVDRLATPEALIPEAIALCADARAGKDGHAAAIKAMIPAGP
ncbi:MAG: enoyl-CoA hydratase/isomerase family protein [Paracoccus sp. (in: a-proteobacteria)]|uniref:enoyl-CoA hydratase/isomerase family protein n=1 Tax=Paracoccus sp. TaxID=267 RepID=UPI0039E24B6C